MSYQTCICLQAQADFSAFWFTLGVRGALLMEMRFTSQQSDVSRQQLNVFDLTLEKRYLFEDPQPAFFNERDVDTLLYAVVQAIELYTGKYPERSVRCKAADDSIQTTIFRMILLANHDILAGMFSIDQEEKERFRPFGRRPDKSFVLKRKPDPQHGPHSVQLTLNTYSQLFGSPVFVRLCEHRTVSPDILQATKN